MVPEDGSRAAEQPAFSSGMTPAFDGAATRWDTAELREINLSPVSYLSAVAVRRGAAWEQAFLHAQTLVAAFGTSRPIRARDAADLCQVIRVWADSQR